MAFFLLHNYMDFIFLVRFLSQTYQLDSMLASGLLLQEGLLVIRHPSKYGSVLFQRVQYYGLRVARICSRRLPGRLFQKRNEHHDFLFHRLGFNNQHSYTRMSCFHRPQYIQLYCQ